MELYCFTPVISLVNNTFNETDIKIEDNLGNVLAHLNEKVFVITVVINNFNTNSPHLLKQVLDDIYEGYFLKKYFNEDFVNVKNESFSKNCRVIPLSEISVEKVQNSPLLMCTSMFNFCFSQESVNVLCFVVVSDNLAFGKSSNDMQKSRPNFADAKNLRYEQLCIVN